MQSKALLADTVTCRPAVLQIPVECPPGTTYGRYFHSLLHTRGLLLLGVHRCVQQDGLSFRATITNPSYVSVCLSAPTVGAWVPLLLVRGCHSLSYLRAWT